MTFKQENSLEMVKKNKFIKKKAYCMIFILGLNQFA